MKEKVNKALAAMSPNGRYDLNSYEEVLKGYKVFDNTVTYVILKELDEAEKDRLISVTAEIILDYAKEFSRHELLWHKNRKEIYEKVIEYFPNLQLKIEARAKQENALYDIKSKIEREGRRLTSRITALTPPDELNSIRRKTEELFKYENLTYEEVAKIEDTDLIEELNVLLKGSKERILNLADVKEKTSPVKLYYYKSSGRISCKININSRSHRYERGMGRSVRYNKGKDKDEYPLIISAHYLEGFLWDNSIYYGDIWIDPRSVDEFYIFDDIITHNLTPTFVETWWAHDCPSLYRCEVNKDKSGYNMLGERLPHFSTLLVEFSFMSSYVDKSITEEEVMLLSDGHRHTSLYNEMRAVLEAKKLADEELQSMLNEVQEYEQKIQQVIDENEPEILEHLKDKFSDRIISEDPLRINDFFGLDCGFLYIQTIDLEYNENKRLLKNSELSKKVRIGLAIQLPYSSQSLTLMKEEFYKIKEIVKREIGEDLYCETVLD